MTSHAHIECDYDAMARLCWDAFIDTGQEAVLVDKLRIIEMYDDISFREDFVGEEDDGD